MPRIFTSGRIVALAAITVVAGGLAYLRFAPTPSHVSVPVGATAGDLILEACEYTTESGSHKADCGVLVVPENSAKPDSRLIALPLIRIRARSEHPTEPVFYLEGGPGITNMEFRQASRFADDRDVILVGYRGVDGSVRLDCPEVTSALRRSTDVLSQESFRAYGDAFRTCAGRLTGEGVDLAGYGLPRQVDDLEAARVALGYDRINLLSQSAGTRTALIYAWRYPERIYRSVMIGVNPPGHFLWDSKTMDEQIGRYAALCAADPTCRRRTDDLTATMSRTATDMPDRWLFLPINASSVRVFSFFGLMESTSQQDPLSSPATLDSWLSAAEGDASGFWLQSLFADLFPIPFVWGQYAAGGSLDAQAAREYFSSVGQERDVNLGYVGTAFAWGGGRLADAWPAAPDGDAYSRVRTSEVETLLIGGALDTSTPPQIATRELLPYLSNGYQVVLPGLGHTASFFAEQPEGGSRLINTFFASGRVDNSLYKPASIDFTPKMTLTGLAKRAAAVMVGLALLMVASLLAMAFWVRRRGGFERGTGTVLRSVYSVVLGLGGWSFGALIVLTTLPGVPLDDTLLAVLSIGVPVGLGIYWGWVHREWPAASKRVGLAWATAGALLGVWLGDQAATGLSALVTAIIGGVAGANLALILLDMSRERSRA